MSRQPGDLLMRVGLVVTVAGLVFTLIAIIPLFVPSVSMPSALWFLAMLTGVGLALVLLGLWRSARARSRAVLTAAGSAAR
jgi:hypothetical protein